MVLCLGEPPVSFFCDFGCCSSFIAVFVLLFVVLHSLLFDVIPHSSVRYRQVFTPILYFQPSSSLVIRDIFILTFPGSSFTVSKYNHQLLVVKSLVYLLLTRFEFFSLVQSICKDYKNHFEQDLYCLQTLR